MHQNPPAPHLVSGLDDIIAELTYRYQDAYNPYMNDPTQGKERIEREAMMLAQKFRLGRTTPAVPREAGVDQQTGETFMSVAGTPEDRVVFKGLDYTPIQYKSIVPFELGSQYGPPQQQPFDPFDGIAPVPSGTWSGSPTTATQAISTAAAASAAAAPTADAAMPPPVPYVSAPFGRSGAGARTAELMRSLALNQYAREQTGRAQTTALSDMGRKFADMRRRIPGEMNRRGMLDSGQRNRAWSRSYGDEVRDRGRIGSTFDAQRFQTDLGDFAAEGTYATGGLQALQDDAARRATAASTIRAARV